MEEGTPQRRLEEREVVPQRQLEAQEEAAEPGHAASQRRQPDLAVLREEAKKLRIPHLKSGTGRSPYDCRQELRRQRRSCKPKHTKKHTQKTHTDVD